MYRNKVTREYKFSYGHRLYDGELTPEENSSCFGKCQGMHGHNGKVLVTVGGPIKNGMVINFSKLDEYVDPIMDRWDHTVLNELEEYMNILPTAETMAEKIFFEVQEKLEKDFPACRVYEVIVYENDRSCASCIG